MKISFLFFSSLFLVIVCFVACKKNDGLSFKQESIIEAAKSYFVREVSSGDASIAPSSKSANWQKATVIDFESAEAVVVPIQFSKPSLIKSSFGGSAIYSADDLTRLLIYKDKNHLYHSELVMSLPDSNYLVSDRRTFSGIIVVKDWGENFLNGYKISDGKTMKLGLESNSANQPKISVNTIPKNSEQSNMLALQVCYSYEQYNYSVDDPEGGVFSTTSLGCNTYFIDDGSITYGGGYANVGSSSGGGGGASGISPVKTFTVVNGNNIIGNIKDYTKCFDNIAGSSHSYQVTLYVDQPKPGTRQTWGFSPSGATGSSFGSNPVDVGHSFMVFTETSGSQTISRNIGFYPQGSVNPYYPSTQGQLNNDAGHIYNISLTVTVTSSQFFNMLNYVDQGNNSGYNYNLNSNNCSSFALHTLYAGNIYLPSTVGTWTGGSGNNPGDLGEDIRTMQLSSNMSRSVQSSPHPNLGSCD